MHLVTLWAILFYIISVERNVHSYSTDVINIEDLITRYYALDETPFWNGLTGEIFSCARACIRRKVCNSFNFNDADGECELHTGVITTDAATRTGIYLLMANVWDWPASILDPDCGSRPCADTEVCFPGRLTSNQTANCSFACIQLPLYNHPCSESGFCSDINGVCINGFCTCPQYMKFSKQEKQCILECGTLPTVTGASHTGDRLQHVYTCNPGFYLVPGSILVTNCTLSGWTAFSVTCRECSTPPELPWATLEHYGTTVGTFSCSYPGTVPTKWSKNTIECTLQGTWLPVDAFYCFGVRLRDGTVNSGVAEVFNNASLWVSLKDTDWSYERNTVFCRQLNSSYQYGGTYHTSSFNTYVSSVTGSVEIQFACTGNEQLLTDCPMSLKTANTKHGDDFGITCYENDIFNPPSVRLTGASNPMWGRLEVLIGGQWYAVCNNHGWGNADTSVACRTINPLWVGRKIDCSDTDCPETGLETLPFFMNSLECSTSHVHFLYCPMSLNVIPCDASDVTKIKCAL